MARSSDCTKTRMLIHSTFHPPRLMHSLPTSKFPGDALGHPARVPLVKYRTTSVYVKGVGASYIVTRNVNDRKPTTSQPFTGTLILFPTTVIGKRDIVSFVDLNSLESGRSSIFSAILCLGPECYVCVCCTICLYACVSDSISGFQPATMKARACLLSTSTSSVVEIVTQCQ